MIFSSYLVVIILPLAQNPLAASLLLRIPSSSSEENYNFNQSPPYNKLRATYNKSQYTQVWLKDDGHKESNILMPYKVNPAVMGCGTDCEVGCWLYGGCMARPG